MTQELQKKCLYYQEGKKPPETYIFDENGGVKEMNFKCVLSACEQYYYTCFYDAARQGHAYWESQFDYVREHYPAFRELLDRTTDKAVRGFLAFTIQDLELHAPHNLEMLLRYGE